MVRVLGVQLSVYSARLMQRYSPLAWWGRTGFAKPPRGPGSKRQDPNGRADDRGCSHFSISRSALSLFGFAIVAKGINRSSGISVLLPEARTHVNFDRLCQRFLRGCDSHRQRVIIDAALYQKWIASKNCANVVVSARLDARSPTARRSHPGVRRSWSKP